MKRNRIMFVIAIVAILAVLFVACDEGTQPEHTHTYGAWDITTAPTEDAVGSATRACACGDVETVELAKLSDTTVWTVEASQDATHTSKGFKVYKSAYGSVTVTTEKTTEHAYGAWNLTKAPTVDEEGSATRVCACGSVDNVNVPKLSDSSVWTTITSQDPTHESKGFVQYTSVYGTVVVDIPAGQHVYGNWELSKAPTATETGLARKYCACGSYEEETVAVLTDSVWTKQHTDATHAAAGADVYTSVYGTVTVVIPQIEHSFTGEYKDNGDGTHSRKCSGCEVYSDAVEHNFSKEVVDDAHKATDADCTHAATYYYSCECGAKSKTLTFESGKANGHYYKDYVLTKAPTLTEAGVAIKTCECGSYVEEAVVALSDTSVWTKTTTAATHAAAGADVYTSVYGTVTVVIPQIEHSFTGEYKDNGDGTHSRKCTGCEAYSDAVAHDFSKKVIDDAHKATDADCTHAATYYYSCVCGAVSTLTYENGKALGHNYSEFKVTKEPTCTETGVAESICENCNETQENVVAALGHKYTDQYEPIEFEYGEFLDTYYQHAPKCDVCGYVNESDSENHTFDNEHFYVTSGGDVYEVCTKCGFYDSEDPISSLSNWTVNERVEADYNKAGYAIYTDGTRTYRKEFAKLVAPYDGKTYYSFELSINDNGVFAVGDSWSTAQITFNENGVGTGTAYPFRGTTKITMVNAETGEIKWTFSGTDYKGYVDFETGIIIRTKAQVFSDVFIMLPVDSGIKKSDLAGSKLADGMAASYTTLCNLHEYHTFNILINDEGVLFGVKLQDKDGNALTSDQCGSANYVKVSAKDGNVLGAYQKNADGAFVKTDNYEGTYGNAQFGDVVLDGIGGATINGKAGVYSYNEEKEYFELYVGESVENATEYYTFTLADGQITVEKPMTTITYVTAYGEDTIGDEYKSVNSNVKFTLPVLANVAEAGVNEFVGWTIEGQEGYVAEYTPNGTTATFTAVWKVLYTVAIVDGANGVESVKVPEGEEIGKYLPVWDKVDERQFIGWFIDSNNDGKYDEDDAEFDTTTTATGNVTIIAGWKDVLACAGNYTLLDTGNGENGCYTYQPKTFVIADDGKITGSISGTVTSYDATTGKLVWSNGVMYFDKTTGMMVAPYSTLESTTISIREVYFGVKGANTEKTKVINYGICGENGSWIARFFEYEGKIAFWYDNAIYSNITITDTAGNALTINKDNSDSIAKSKTVVVKDSNGNIVFARASVESSFYGGKKSTALDSYYGSYTNESATELVLNGAGNFTWGEKSGTYTLVDAETKAFDLYVKDNDGKNVEYYVVTLNGSTYSSEKPMVTVTYTTAVTPVEALEASVQVNKNIEFTLPTLTNADNMFRGWMIEGNATVYSGTYTATKNVDFTAKWDTKYVFTAVYNDGKTDNLVKTYGEGDIVDLATPVWAKHRFDGWFTTASFNEGTEWKSGSKITATVTVYAKWSDAEPWYNTYMPLEYVGVEENGNKENPYIRSSAVFSVDADGLSKCTSYPFRGDIEMYYTDKENGKLNVTVGSSKYVAYIDKTTGIIVMNASTTKETFASVWVLTPFETSSSVNAPSSYWNSGATRVIEYTFNNTVYRIFIHNGSVYFGTTFMDAAENGNAVAAENCYNAESLFVFGSDGAEIARFVYNGTTMVETDGFEGTYKNVDNQEVSITLNGAGTITFSTNDIVGTYTKSGVDDYDFDVIAGNKSYKLSIDKDNKTYAIVENTVKITYESDGETIEPQTAFVGIPSQLYTPAKRADMVFKGWYVKDDASQTLVSMTAYVTDTAVTLVAKWVTKAILTVVYENGIENATYEFGVGDTLNMSSYVPEYTNGKVFSKWTILGADGVKTDFTATTITENITVYCEWLEAVKWYGSYITANIYGNDDRTGKYASTLTVSATGIVSGKTTGTINADGTAIVDGSYSKFMASDGNVIAFPDKNVTSNLATDFHVAVKADAGTSIHQYKHLGAANKVVVSYIKDGQTIYVLVWESKVYDNVTWTSTDGEVTASNLYNKVATLTFYDRTGQAITLA